MKNYSKIVIGLVIGLILVTAICTVASASVSTERSIRPVMWQFTCMIVIQMVLIAFILDYSIKNYGSMDSRLTLLIEVGIINECGDAYSAVPYNVTSLTSNFGEAENKQKQVTVLAIVSMVVLLLPIFMVCGCVCCWSVINKSKANNN